MQPQQLQSARAALWRQNAAPLVTLDDAASWLDQLGLCLFLPRYAQLPSPAPSFVEACLGASSNAPPAAVLATAHELATRLVAEGRALPLNLLGTFSEQPDFLLASDILPWVAAVRGDRQWKSAPAGRTAPLVFRTWLALEEHGPQTAAELQERLGRELTEGAILRALIELWTSLRALPEYAAAGSTRWSLTKDCYAAQLTTAANTAQPTALSALISLYLRSAIAATAQEIEVFLSPLTARSRIREVVHGMTAARQLASMSVGTHTLLFIEGSLPETVDVPETAQRAEPPVRNAPRVPESRPGRPPFRKPAPQMPRFVARDSGPARKSGSNQDRRRPPFSDRLGPRPERPSADRRGPSRPWQKREFPARNPRPGGRYQNQAGRRSEGEKEASPRRAFEDSRPDRPRFERAPDARPRGRFDPRRSPRRDEQGDERRIRPSGKRPDFRVTQPQDRRPGKPFPARQRFSSPGRPAWKSNRRDEGGGPDERQENRESSSEQRFRKPRLPGSFGPRKGSFGSRPGNSGAGKGRFAAPKPSGGKFTKDGKSFRKPSGAGSGRAFGSRPNQSVRAGAPGGGKFGPKPGSGPNRASGRPGRGKFSSGSKFQKSGPKTQKNLGSAGPKPRAPRKNPKQDENPS